MELKTTTIYTVHRGCTEIYSTATNMRALTHLSAKDAEELVIDCYSDDITREIMEFGNLESALEFAKSLPAPRTFTVGCSVGFAVIALYTVVDCTEYTNDDDFICCDIHYISVAPWEK